MLRRNITIAVVLLVIAMAIPWVKTRAASLAEQTSGLILLQVERNGEAWYVYPTSLTRFYLGRPFDAFNIMRRQGLGITNENLSKIPRAGTNDGPGDMKLRKQVSGIILLQVERNGEAWYVYPPTLERYYLGRPNDAFDIMRQLGLGISNDNIAQIPVDGGVTVTQKIVSTSRGNFTMNALSFDRKNPALKIGTDTGNTSNCSTNCTVNSLGTYIGRRSGLAGIHGTYFCPADYSSCSNEINHYFFPVYNTYSKVMINGDRIKFTTEPLVAFDGANRPYFYLHANQFTSEQDFYNDFGADSLAAGGDGKLRAAISNGPPLVINSQNVVSQYSLDSKQATVKSYRGVLGWRGDTIVLMVVSGATVTDSAAVAQAYGLEYAINLDGGGSTALYNSGHYIVGPGRSLPNAIVITQ